MTGYDLQLHLRYRNSIKNKETELRHCSCTKMFLDKVVNFRDFSRPNKEIKTVLFKNINRIQGLFKTTTTFQDLIKIVRTMG